MLKGPNSRCSPGPPRIHSPYRRETRRRESPAPRFPPSDGKPGDRTRTRAGSAASQRSFRLSPPRPPRSPGRPALTGHVSGFRKSVTAIGGLSPAGWGQAAAIGSAFCHSCVCMQGASLTSSRCPRKRAPVTRAGPWAGAHGDVGSGHSGAGGEAAPTGTRASAVLGAFRWFVPCSSGFRVSPQKRYRWEMHVDVFRTTCYPVVTEPLGDGKCEEPPPDFLTSQGPRSCPRGAPDGAPRSQPAREIPLFGKHAVWLHVFLPCPKATSNVAPPSRP